MPPGFFFARPAAMEIKDPNSSGTDPTGDQPTLDGIPSPAGLSARYDILGEVGRGRRAVWGLRYSRRPLIE